MKSPKIKTKTKIDFGKAKCLRLVFVNLFIIIFFHCAHYGSSFFLEIQKFHSTMFRLVCTQACFGFSKKKKKDKYSTLITFILFIIRLIKLIYKLLCCQCSTEI